MLNKNDLKAFGLIFAFGFLIFCSYFVFPTFLGYDSYFFLEKVCGESARFDAASIQTVPPFANLVFNALPCNVFLLKLISVLLLMVSLVVIYGISRLEHGSDAWRAIPFTLIFPVFVLNSLKIENDVWAYPFLFGSFYFFLKHLEEKAISFALAMKVGHKNLFLCLACLGIAMLFWGGSIYYLIYFALFEIKLLFFAIPIGIIFFEQITGPFFPDYLVQENNPIGAVRQVTVFFSLFLLSNNIKAVSKQKWLMALPFLVFGLMNPKFLILLTPFIPVILISAWKNADPLTKPIITPLATLIAIAFVLQIGLGWHGPYEREHELTQEIIQMGEDQNMLIQNDWGLGHLFYYYGYATTKHSGLANIDCHDCYILTYETPRYNCKFIKEKQQLTIYKC